MWQRVLAVSIVAFTASPLLAQADRPLTETVDGNYQTAWFELKSGGVDLQNKKTLMFDVPLFVGFRSGRAVTAWFAHSKLARERMMWMDAATLELRGGTLKGELRGRTSLNWGDKTVHDFVYVIDGTNQEGQLAGTFTATFTTADGVARGTQGKFTGRLASDADLKRRELPQDRNWPHYYGDGASFQSPKCDVRLIEDLAAAQPLWKSEAFVPTAYGSAPDSRYYERAGRTNNGGGSSSPIVHRGRVYQFFYYPRGPVGQSKAHAKYETEDDLAAIARELFPKREIEQNQVINHFRTQADEKLVCLDGATGKTLWTTTVPQRGNNYQTHKHRGLFPVPLADGDVIYQAGTTGRLYAIDADGGGLLWEYPDAAPPPYETKQGGIDCGAPSPLVIGELVIFSAGNKVTALDKRTGKRTWQIPLWQRSSLLAWKGPTKTVVIASDRDHQANQSYAVGLDASNGHVLWRHPIEYLTNYAFPLQVGARLIGYSVVLENVKPGENDGLAVIHAYDISESGLTKSWSTKPLAPIVDTVGLTADAKHVYVSAARDVFRIDLTDGAAKGTIQDVGGARTQTAFLAGGRLFIQPEGRHGKQSFFMLDVAGPELKLLGASQAEPGTAHPDGGDKQWLPPHSWTTAYANQPIVYPHVDGRLFVRGLDAVYCYDLRAQSQ